MSDTLIPSAPAPPATVAPVTPKATASHAPAAAASPHPGMGLAEFVALIASLMSLTAFAIDIMLPALPAIGADLGATGPNQTQLVLVVFLVSLGVGQIAYGPLSDRYGRRPVLTVGLIVFLIGSLVTLVADGFEMLLGGRAVQGLGAASARVLGQAIARDCYAGRQMGRVMSLAMMVFMAVPICAPVVGGWVLEAAGWRPVFGVLLAGGIVQLLWVVLRLPETLSGDARRPLSGRLLWAAARDTLGNRVTVCYMAAMAVLLSTLFAFNSSVQQVFMETFGLGTEFTYLLGLMAVGLVASSFMNARLVVRLGMRRLSHAALLGYLMTSLVHMGLVLAGHETLVTFMLAQALTLFLFGFMGPNFTAIAMEPLGHIAGAASSIQGLITTVVGAVLGGLVGQAFDGTTLPLVTAFAGFGALALVFVAIAERGRLLRTGTPPAR